MAKGKIPRSIGSPDKVRGPSDVEEYAYRGKRTVISHSRRVRESQGLSQLQVAADAGLCIKTIQRIEAGDVMAMHMESICRLAIALGVSVPELLPPLAVRPRTQRSSPPRRSRSKPAPRRRVP